MVDAPLKVDIHKPTPPELLKQLPGGSAALLGPALVKSVNAAAASSNSGALVKQEPSKSYICLFSVFQRLFFFV